MDTTTAPAVLQGSAEPAPHAVPSCAFVLFGATGDLTHRKIIPALFSLSIQQLLPKGFVIVAFARRDKTDESYREDLRSAVRQFAPKMPADGVEWDEFARNIVYLRSNFDDADGYRRLGERLNQLDQERDLGGNRLFYLATPPDNFSEILCFLGEAGLNRLARAG